MTGRLDSSDSDSDLAPSRKSDPSPSSPIPHSNNSNNPNYPAGNNNNNDSDSDLDVIRLSNTPNNPIDSDSDLDVVRPNDNPDNPEVPVVKRRGLQTKQEFQQDRQGKLDKINEAARKASLSAVGQTVRTPHSLALLYIHTDIHTLLFSLSLSLALNWGYVYDNPIYMHSYDHPGIRCTATKTGRS